jgi:hypothetical protein
MPTFTLTDLAHDLWLESFRLSPADLGLPAAPPWSITKRTLRGGRRDGVDLIEVDNGALSFAIVPSRGLGIWKGRYQGDPIGWRSPVRDGPIHPSLVNLMDRGGLGWLDGFDELFVRCGLEHNGAPYQDGATTHPLHGRIANTPAHHVAIRIDEQPPHAITIEGHVDEARLFFLQARLVSTITTVPGSNALTVRDEVTNLGASPGSIQLLYHCNFGPPYLEEGSRFVAPIKAACPRNARAVEGLGHFDTYTGPEPGFAEQVYFFELHGDGPDGRTLALLRDRDGQKGVALRFRTRELPCFTLWKCTRGLDEGYVTGLEPATNYPNPKPVEKERKRVVPLAPGGRFVAETVFEVLDTKAAVAAVEAEIEAIQKQGAPTIHPQPVEPFSPAPGLP